MYYAIAVILVVLWLAGFVAFYTMGGLLLVLLLIGAVTVGGRFMRKQNAGGPTKYLGRRYDN